MKPESLGTDFSVNEQRTALLTRAVRGFPSRKPNHNGGFAFDLTQIDLNKVNINTVYTGDAKSKVEDTFYPARSPELE
jgi:hypothetical protein